MASAIKSIELTTDELLKIDTVDQNALINTSPPDPLSLYDVVRQVSHKEHPTINTDGTWSYANPPEDEYNVWVGSHWEVFRKGETRSVSVRE